MTRDDFKRGGRNAVVVHGRLVITWRPSGKCATVVRLDEDEFLIIVDY